MATVESSPPPFFRQGPSAFSRLLAFGSLAIFIMYADGKLGLIQPLRLTLATLLTPLQWSLVQPISWARAGSDFMAHTLGTYEETKRLELTLLESAQRAQQTEQLQLENQRLRELLDLRASHASTGIVGQILYDTSDPYSRKIVINKGLFHHVQIGSAVIDTMGVVGQVTQVYPAYSEVSLLTDGNQTIPVQNMRTGTRHIAYGDPLFLGGSLELRFVPASSDIQEGDLLVTSGLDKLYPPGLHVARVNKVDRRADSSFARIHAAPLSKQTGRHVLILNTAEAPAASPEASEGAAKSAPGGSPLPPPASSP
jgi:rod shape-determining protein MreC